MTDEDYFRGDFTAAPLKRWHFHCVARVVHSQDFRGDFTAAPLKPKLGNRAVCVLRNFRGDFTAAPLRTARGPLSRGADV